MPTGILVAINIESRTRPLAIRAVIRRAISAAARFEAVEPGMSVSVLVTGDQEIRELNHRFAGEDHATDVLAFAAGDVPGHPGEDGELGDIVLSLDHLRVQADGAGHSLEREAAVLAIHGFLHLLGYDHADADEARRMFGRTDQILARLAGLAT